MTQIDPVLRALAHPTRLRMITLMWPTPMSAAELARELDISHALASQHLRRLAAVNIVEVAEERIKRGGKERRYRMVHGSPLSDQSPGSPLMAEALIRNLRERVALGTDAGPGVTIDADLWMDPEVWQKIRRRFVDFAIEMHDAAQPAHSPGTIRLGVTTMAFPMKEEDSSGPAEDEASDDQ